MAEKFNAIGFISHIVSLRERDDRKSMAELRRAKSATQQSGAYAHVMPYVGSVFDSTLVNMMCVVGAHAVSADKIVIYDQKRKNVWNFGDALRVLNNMLPNSSSISLADRYIKKLIACDRDILPMQINHIMSIINSKSIAVDYVRLISDMNYWNESTRIKWASHYYHSDKEG